MLDSFKDLNEKEPKLVREFLVFLYGLLVISLLLANSKLQFTSDFYILVLFLLYPLYYLQIGLRKYYKQYKKGNKKKIVSSINQQVFIVIFSLILVAYVGSVVYLFELNKVNLSIFIILSIFVLIIWVIGGLLLMIKFDSAVQNYIFEYSTYDVKDTEKFLETYNLQDSVSITEKNDHVLVELNNNSIDYQEFKNDLENWLDFPISIKRSIKIEDNS